jgi:hypothetical protein
VVYAVDLMVVLRCTRRLLFRLKQFDDAPAVRSTTRLGDWYGNLLRVGNRHALLFISERSRLPVLIPVREANRLRSAFPDAVCQMLAAVGVPVEAIEGERLQMSQIGFDRTKSRSLLGSVNDFSLMARVRFITARSEPLELIARELAETPLSAPPIRVPSRASSLEWNDRSTRSLRFDIFRSAGASRLPSGASGHDPPSALLCAGPEYVPTLPLEVSEAARRRSLFYTALASRMSP